MMLKYPAIWENKITTGNKMTTLYDFTVRDIEGGEIPLSDYRGKVLLIVNLASRCGLTPQIGGLQQLYESYAERGFEVLAFPCNQFMRLAPEPAAEMVQAFREKFGLSFKVFDKVDVNGEQADPLYVWLKGQKASDNGGKAFESMLASLTALGRHAAAEGDIRWNFTKFLISRTGEVVERFAPGATAAEIEGRIREVLDEV